MQKTDKDIQDEKQDAKEDMKEMLGRLKTSRNPMLAFFNQVNQIRAETFVIKKLLD